MSGPADHRPRFSVIMPVYNHADYVGEAVASVRRQTVEDWELLIVDDGSTDGSGRIVDRLAAEDGRITVMHQANAGPAAARNAALARARGDWLAFIDSDDVWYDDALAAYRGFIAAHGDVQFLYGWRNRLNADGSITELAGEFQDRPTGTAELFGRMYLSHLCVCWRRALLDKVGGYDAALRNCEDYELYLRLSLHCRFEPIGRATGLRRRHGTNISRQTGYSRFQEAEVLRRFVQRQGGAAVLDEKVVRRRLGRLYYTAGRQYFRARCYRQAAAAMAEAHRYRRGAKSMALSVLARLLRPGGRDDGRELPRL